VLRLQDDLLERAAKDSLTGLLNRGMLLETLERELLRAQREAAPLSVAMVDLDHFKRINDVHGHAAGDEVLRHAAQRMAHSVRRQDVVGRYGGEEFLAVLPGCSLLGAESLAERMRVALQQAGIPLDGSKPLQVSASIGVASTTAFDSRCGREELLRAADQALYVAKREGRNCVRSIDGVLLPQA
jgi:diguanylate cyclase (GGDEF)-like protein